MAGAIVLILIILLVLRTLVAQPYEVEQGDMRNTLLPNQSVLVDKLTPHFDAYKRGDLVVFTPPGDAPGSFAFIKRVIGVPGETVDLRNGQVLINDQEISEPYVFKGQATEPGPLDNSDHWVVPANALFVLGDHREISNDSRNFGPIPISSVIGRAWLRYWPLAAFEVLPAPRYPNMTPLAPVASPADG